MEERIVELELRSMQQQRTIEELSDVLYRQQKELDSLKALLQQLAQKIPEPGLVDEKVPERPPHY
jgi:SlyX protein